MNKILEILRRRNIKYTTSEEIKRDCTKLGKNYYNEIRYLTSHRYLITIFRGIFYIKSFDEYKFNKIETSPLELISKGLELRNVSNWYFGLYTALKFNKVSHEYHSVSYIFNDIFRNPKPTKIGGYTYEFKKIKQSLMKFGIQENAYKYSDLEKTILDFIYIWKYHRIPDKKIILDLSEYINSITRDRILEYSKYYPKSNSKILKALI